MIFVLLTSQRDFGIRPNFSKLPLTDHLQPVNAMLKPSSLQLPINQKLDFPASCHLLQISFERCRYYCLLYPISPSAMPYPPPPLNLFLALKLKCILLTVPRNRMKLALAYEPNITGYGSQEALLLASVPLCPFQWIFIPKSTVTFSMTFSAVIHSYEFVVTTGTWLNGDALYRDIAVPR